MRNLVIVLTAVFLFFSSRGFCGENIYTWKDKDGVLNITDQAPPSGAQIIDVRPSHRVEAEQMLRQRQIRQRELEAQDLRRERTRKAAEARKKKAAERRQAEQLLIEQQQKVKEQSKPKKRKGY